MYSISAYGEMIADDVRTSAYAQALRQTVKPGSVVADIGTGTGFFAMMACQFGGRRIYAIEPADAIQIAKEIAQANGYADRIEFIQNRSTQVTLPEKADVIISDMRSVLPWFQHHIPSIVDARNRFLAPGGVLIPQRDTLWAAVVEAPDLYSRHLSHWDENPWGLHVEAGRRIVVNTWRKGRLTSDQLLVEPERWAVLDYATIENPDVHAEISWTVTRSGTGHGLNVWFDTILFEGIGFSNGPDQPELIYGSAFFPWLQPVELFAGDVVYVVLSADLVCDDYVWRWETKVMREGQPTDVVANFKQSTFFGTPLSLSNLHKRANNYLPKLDDDGLIDSFALARMDGKTSSEEIARELVTRCPERFRKFEDALTRIGDLAEKYAK